MALVVYDRVQQTGTANTTVSFTLSATTTGYQSFAAVGNGNTTYYAATDGTNWEVGLGTYSTTGPTLTRTTILSSSNSGSAVTFSGTVTVWVDYPAGKAVYQDSTGNVSVSNLTDSALTSSRVTYAGTSGLLQDSANMTFSGTALTLANDATISTLTVGRGNGALSANTAFGYLALNAATAGNNTGIGYQAGKAITSGNSNVFVGQYSGQTLTNALLNTGVGHGALANSNAQGNTALGYSAGGAFTSGGANTIIGQSAGATNQTGSNNVVVGTNAMFAGVTGSQNVAVGNQAMQQSTGVSNMVAVGQSAMLSTTTTLNTGTTNIGTITGGSGYTPASGTQVYSAVALSRVSGTAVINAGNYGTANITVTNGAVTAVSIVGVGNGYVDTTTVLTVSNTLIGGTGTNFQFTLTGSLLSASSNVGVGSSALSANTTGSSLSALGNNAGSAVTTGSNSVFIGTGSGSTGTSTTTGFQLVYIGSGSRGSAATNQNEIAIGYNATGLGSNTTVIGNSSTTATYIYGSIVHNAPISTTAAAPTIASASTIAPTTLISFVSGTTTINTITAPAPLSSGGGQITLIPTGIFTTGITGNIAVASTAVVSRALIMTYDSTTAKWYPSY